MLKIVDKKRFVLFSFCVVAVAAGILFGAYETYKFFTKTKSPYQMSFADAGKIGEKKVYQVAIKINKGNESGELQRGDVIMTAPEDKQWSIAEKEGFLIIKANLTEKQAELLVQSKDDLIMPKENRGDENEKKQPRPAENSGRRFAIDLDKIGSQDEERGKIISDRVFEGDIVVEKK